MIQVGKTNQLQVAAEFPFGFQLTATGDDDTTVTLASTSAPPDLKVGDTLEAFVTTDNAGALIAFAQTPLIQIGETRVLRAVNATDFGAFFDWGLEKDLLVPAQYQEQPVNPGMHYVVHAFFDEKTSRVLGATKLHYFLRDKETGLEAGTQVECIVYSKTELGYKVVVNEVYAGLIFHFDAFKPLRIGEKLDAVIKNVREDGKLDIALQRVDKVGRRTLEEAIIDDLEAHGGFSTLTDKSQPDEIYARFNVSKAAYKKALGALYKQRKIVIDKQAVRLVTK